MNDTNLHKRQALQQQVKETCSELVVKLEQLHNQVFKPVQKAQEAVAQTVDTVKQTVDTAKNAIDTVGEHIAQHPWLVIAGSMAAGVSTGYLTSSLKPGAPQPVMAAAALPPKPGFFQRQLNKLTEISIGAGVALVRDLMKQRMPDEYCGLADHVACNLTQQFGGVPFMAPILPQNNADELNTPDYQTVASAL
jgi:ElaB/YqjD/DUF883 family membrane-anchored ribosome-binding protein